MNGLTLHFHRILKLRLSEISHFPKTERCDEFSSRSLFVTNIEGETQEISLFAPREDLLTIRGGGLSDAAQLLSDILDYLNDREDVHDSSDGRPSPNEAMAMLLEFGDRIQKEVRCRKEAKA